jgi:membrane fusion protein (multidrug efflux system)
MPVDESKANNQDKIKNPVESDITAAAALQELPGPDTVDMDALTVTPQEPEPVNDLQADKRRWMMKGALGLVALAIALYFGIPWVVRALNTVSTDDAYVNGHVTFVAARIPDQVVKVLVDNNNRVRKGDILIELDKAPYQILVDIKDAAVTKAKADLVAAQAEARSIEAQARSQRWKLQHAMEGVGSQIALLRAKAAVLESDKAELKLAEANFERAKGLTSKGAMASEEYDRRRKAFLVAKDQIERDLAEIAQVRVDMGLPALPPKGVDLTHVPSNIEQTFSSVRQAQADLIQRAAQLGIIHSFAETPKQMIDEFMKRAPQGDSDRLFRQIVNDVPAVKQAEAKLLQAQRDLEQAQLNLSYCTITADIDGVITRRNVNPGDNVQIGQGLMAIRSLREIWIDANFKETELADLRIGQPADLYVDMYGGQRVFHGHISGFTMGTGSTLSLLPAQNATGNFIKVVQRLPVRIDLDSYDPDKAPLFIGLSVVPYVYINKTPTGPNAGKVLQPYQQSPTGDAAGQPLEPKP